MTQKFPLVALCCAIGLGACDTIETPTIASITEPDLLVTREPGPPNATPDACYGKETSPAVIETVTNQVLIRQAQFADDGTRLSSAVYRTETIQKIIKERQDTWFRTPCARDLTPDFVASVQRALKARGHYRGRITGEMDAKTRRAIRRFQSPQGLSSGILSLAAARKLGLVAIETDRDT